MKTKDIRRLDTFKIDTYRVKQYEERRVVDTVVVETKPKPRARLILCYSPNLRATVLIPISELK